MIGVTHLQGLKRKIINKASGGISSNFGNIALLNGSKWGWVKSLLSHECEIHIHQHQLSCEPAMGTRVLTISWGETALSHTEFRLRPDLCSKML